jgi:hypothetical protein
MKTTIRKIDWFLGEDPPEGTVTFEGKNGRLVDAFSWGQKFLLGSSVEIELSSIDAPLEWKIQFSENKNKETKLVKSAGNWEYEGYGQIKSIHPVIIDFGDIDLNTGDWTDDIGLVNEYIYWKIDRLDLTKNNGYS